MKNTGSRAGQSGEMIPLLSDEGGGTEQWMVISVSGAGCPYGPCLTWYTKLNSKMNHKS